MTPSPEASTGTLERLQSELRLRCYSPRTIKVYVAHARAFLRFLAAPPEHAPDDRIRAYFVDLVERKNVSRAYLNQALSAVKFLYRHVLGSPRAVADLPRPRPTRRLPRVLSRPEVVRLLGSARNPQGSS